MSKKTDPTTLLLGIIIAVLGFPLFIMLLINGLFSETLVSDIFGGPLSYLQAMGLFVLCRLLCISVESSKE